MALVVLISLCSGSSAPGSSTQAAKGVADDPTALVRRATQNALAERSHRQPLRYQVRKVDKRSDTTKEIVETKDGAVARLIAIDGNPLSAEADQAERHRLNYLSGHSKLQEHRRKREQEVIDRVNRLMRLLPEAFLYRYEGMTLCKNGQCYCLGFTPNPQFDAPSEESKIFRGMAGEVWIDPTEERMVKLDAPPDRGGRFWLGDYRQAPQGRNDSAGADPRGRPPVGADPHEAQPDGQGIADQVTRHSDDRRQERNLSCEPRDELSTGDPVARKSWSQRVTGGWGP
jgi:hypothetical protein